MNETIYSIAIQALLAKKTVLSAWVGAGLVLALVIDPNILAAAIVTVVTALTGSVVIIINAVSKAKRELLEAQAETTARVKTVEGHVDGMQRAAEAKRTADDDTIMSLKVQLGEANKRAEMLAQARAVAEAGIPSFISAPGATGAGSTAVAPAPKTPTVLKRIEANTAETAENTKRTDDNVQDLKDDAKR